MHPVKISCPHCRQTLSVAGRSVEGATIRCPACSRSFRWTFPVGAEGSAAVAAGPPPKSAPETPAAQAAPAPGAPETPSIQKPRRRGRRLVFAAVVLLFLAGGGFILLGNPFAPNEQETEIAVDLGWGKKKAPGPRPLIALTAEEERRVQELTDRGVAWLRKQQLPDGSFQHFHGNWREGGTAMAGLTLLECGVPAADDAVRRAAGRLRQTAHGLSRTYELTLAILFFDRLQDPADLPLLRMLAVRLQMGQKLEGSWHYDCPVPNPAEQEMFVQFLQSRPNQAGTNWPAGMDLVTQSFSQGLQGQPFLRDVPYKVPADFYRHGGDNSNTQFAILGLWAARKNKLPVDRTLRRTVQRFRRSQNEDGSWNYEGRRNVVPEPTMTCAGLLGLAVGYGLDGKEEFKGKRPEEDAAIRKALEHLGKSIGAPLVAGGKKEALPRLYYLWSVERVGVLFRLKEIGGKDWYRWGMTLLEAYQKADGSWPHDHQIGSPLSDTCFALLFLQRVDLAQDLTDKLTEMERQALAAGGAGKRE